MQVVKVPIGEMETHYFSQADIGNKTELINRDRITNHFENLFPNHQEQQLTFTYSLFLTNFSLKACIKSLEETPLPDIKRLDSNLTKTVKTINAQWHNNRIDLLVYMGAEGGQEVLVGINPMTNPTGFPYQDFNLMDLITDDIAYPLGVNGKLSVELFSPSNHTLTNDDYVYTWLSWSAELVVVNPNSNISNNWQ